jgi:hypothetical protein
MPGTRLRPHAPPAEDIEFLCALAKEMTGEAGYFHAGYPKRVKAITLALKRYLTARRKIEGP